MIGAIDPYENIELYLEEADIGKDAVEGRLVDMANRAIRPARLVINDALELHEAARDNYTVHISPQAAQKAYENGYEMPYGPGMIRITNVAQTPNFRYNLIKSFLV